MIIVQETTEFGVALQSSNYKVGWRKCSNLPVAMAYAHATVINDTLYIGGGSCPTGNDDYFMFSYKMTDNQWKRLPILPQCYGVPTSIDNQLSYVGGFDFSASRSTNKVITFKDDHWTIVYPEMKEAREWPAVVSYQNYTIVAGGEGKDQSTLDTIEVFNCNDKQWTVVSTHLPHPMMNISATICNQSFIITGYTGADGKCYNGTYIITMDSLVETEQHSLTSSTSEDNNKWNELFNTPYRNTTNVPNTSPPLTIGGDDEQCKAVDKISLYDDSSNSWKTVSLLPISCARATVTTINNIIIVAGGYTDGKTYESANATSLASVWLGQLETCK